MASFDWVKNLDFSKPFDISIPLSNGENNPRAFGISHPVFSAFQGKNFVGDVSKGGACNVTNIFFSPHGNGTHTECFGHLGIGAENQVFREGFGVQDCFKIRDAISVFWFKALLITVQPSIVEQGSVQRYIYKSDIENSLIGSMSGIKPEALIVRTLPNNLDKLSCDYTNLNPPAFDPEALEFLCDQSILHLITDLPSVDPENDGGSLAAHKKFWGENYAARYNATITELAYVPNCIPDGFYGLNLMLCNLETEVSPSRPVLYPYL
jgi:hypothetical protein